MRSHGDNYGILRIHERSRTPRYRLKRLFAQMQIRDWMERHEEAKWRAMVDQRRDPNTRDAKPYFLKRW